MSLRVLAWREVLLTCLSYKCLSNDHFLFLNLTNSGLQYVTVPTMPSADFSCVVAQHRCCSSLVSKATHEISRGKMVLFPAVTQNLHSSVTSGVWVSISSAIFPTDACLLFCFCSLQPTFRLQLPSDSTSRWTPLPQLVVPSRRPTGDFNPQQHHHARRTHQQPPTKVGGMLKA